MARSSCEGSLLPLIERAYDAAVGLEPWSSFLGALEAEDGAPVALFLPFPTDACPGRAISPSISADLLESYQGRYFALDPAAPHVSKLRPGEVTSFNGIPSRSVPESAVFEREWLEPQGLGSSSSAIGVVDRIERGVGSGTFVLRGFSRQGSDGVPRERAARWRMLMPHLRRTLRILRMREQLASERCALAAALDRLPAGLFFLDSLGDVVAKNRAADRILAEGDGLSLSGDGLHATGCALTERLERAVKQASSRNARSPSAALLPRPSGRRALEVVAVGTPSESSGTLAGGSTTLYVVDSDQPVDMPAEVLAQLFELTPAEASLACEIAGGRSIEQAAERLGVTLGTVRSRLKTIFLKTGTHRQSELVARLLSGPAHLLTGLRPGARAEADGRKTPGSGGRGRPAGAARRPATTVAPV